MPIALVRYNPYFVAESHIQCVVDCLPMMIAKHLSVPGTDGELGPADVEVWVNPTGPLDVNKKDFVIVVLAGLYPEREQNLDERRKNLAEEIRSLLPLLPGSPKWTGFLWIVLQPQSFGEW